jgi:HlyD family secretion protein
MSQRLIIAAAVAGRLLAGCAATAPSAFITGLVDATEVDVASKIPGRIKELKVHEGELVQEGQALAIIQSDELGAKLEQATATIAAAEAKLKLAQRGARREDREAAAGAREAAAHQVELAKKMYDRMTALLGAGSIAQASFDDAEAKYNLAKDQLDIATTRLDLVQHGARAEELEGLEAIVKQSKGMLAEVQSYNEETVQRAPLTGEVAKIVLHRGELAASGYPILTLVDRQDVWVTFPVREDLLKTIKPGTVLDVRVPALDASVPMTVFAISAMGDFATWKATNEKTGFDLKSFEVKARPTEKVEGLRAGMTARFVPRR